MTKPGQVKALRDEIARITADSKKKDRMNNEIIAVLATVYVQYMEK